MRVGELAGAAGSPGIRVRIDALAGAVRSRAARALAHAHHAPDAIDRRGPWLETAPVLIVISAGVPDAATLLECGRLGQSLVVAARARGLDAVPLAVDAQARAIGDAIGNARDEVPAIAIAAGYPRRGTSRVALDARAPTVTCLGFD